MYEICISLRMILIGLGIKTGNSLKRTIRDLKIRGREQLRVLLLNERFICVLDSP